MKASSNASLRNKVVLVVDDEPDILEVVSEQLDGCLVYKAANYEAGAQYISSINFDIVILDIMGVNGFDLLKMSVHRGFPTVMLTAHGLTLEALKKSIKLGAVSFLPKERIPELKVFLEDVVLGGGKPVWKKLFDRIGTSLMRHFGNEWAKEDAFFEELMAELPSDSARATEEAGEAKPSARKS